MVISDMERTTLGQTGHQAGLQGGAGQVEGEHPPGDAGRAQQQRHEACSSSETFWIRSSHIVHQLI